MRLGSIRALTSSPTHLGLRQADVAFGLDPHHFPGQGAKWTQVRQIVGNQNIDALACLAGAWWILQQCAILRRCCQDSCSNRLLQQSVRRLSRRRAESAPSAFCVETTIHVDLVLRHITRHQRQTDCLLTGQRALVYSLS